MLLVAAGRRAAALLAAAVLILCASAAFAQQVQPVGDQPLDPAAPMQALPDLGVEWPSLETEPDKKISTTPDASVADVTAERTYTVDIEGLDQEETEGLRGQFRLMSALEASRHERANAAQLDRRARQDADLLVGLLRSYGYYDASVDTRIEPVAGVKNSVRVVLAAEPGTLYHFTEVALPGIEGAGSDAAALRETFGVKQGDAVSAAKVTAGQAALNVELGKLGYAFADVGSLDIAVNHETHAATLSLPVNPNGTRQFGQITVSGKPPFSASHVQTIARFHPGDPYRAAMLDDLRRALIQTGLVSTVTIKPIENPQTKRVDVDVAMGRAPMHTIAGAAGYGTGEGYRIEASWQHRNLIKPEGAVTFRGVLGTQEQLVSAELRRSNFHQRDEVLSANVTASHVDQDAYEAKTFDLGAALERQTNIIWQKKWTWSIGGDLIASDEKDVDVDTGTIRQRTYFIAAVPLTLAYDGSNDLLDPTTGYRLSGRLSPELSLQNSVFGYGRLQLDGSVYFPATPKLTIAARTRLGTIVGASRDRIAPSRRFYAGGGGSVRGYGYQDLGPRDPVFDDPIGGRSLAEFALEARYRFGNFGIVPFLDAGNIYTSPLPHITDLRFGTGLGLRYYTRFGPIRVDVGTPLNREKGDARVAVYVSLGQAF